MNLALALRVLSPQSQFYWGHYSPGALQVATALKELLNGKLAWQEILMLTAYLARWGVAKADHVTGRGGLRAGCSGLRVASGYHAIEQVIAVREVLGDPLKRGG